MVLGGPLFVPSSRSSYTLSLCSILTQSASDCSCVGDFSTNGIGLLESGYTRGKCLAKTANPPLALKTSKVLSMQLHKVNRLPLLGLVDSSKMKEWRSVISRN